MAEKKKPRKNPQAVKEALAVGQEAHAKPKPKPKKPKEMPQIDNKEIDRIAKKAYKEQTQDSKQDKQNSRGKAQPPQQATQDSKQGGCSSSKALPNETDHENSLKGSLENDIPTLLVDPPLPPVKPIKEVKDEYVRSMGLEPVDGPKTTDADALNMGRLAEEGYTQAQIAEIYGCDNSWVSKMLKKPEVVRLREIYSEQKKASLYRAVYKNLPQIETMTDTYIAEALKPERIEKTALPGLFTVWGIIVDKQLKIQEIELKREELKQRREEAAKAAQSDTGLMGAFIDVMRGLNTLPKDEPEAEIDPLEPGTDTNSDTLL